MNKAAWIIFGSMIVLIIGALVVYSRLNNPAIDVGSINPNGIVAASSQSGDIADHVFGNTDSKVILIEYGDFQCPSCGGAHPQIKAVTEEYKDRIAFIFRNFPLTSIHPNAKAAAGAVEAAGLQGKYWEMHNLVFESQQDWSSLTGAERNSAFVGYAESLGLDKDRFLSDLAAEQVNKKISFDLALGKKVGVEATPTFYLNGNKVSTDTASAIVQGSTTELKELLDATLGQ